MLQPFDLIAHASRLVSAQTPDEADRRRAVSAAYYALFHALTQAGASMYHAGPGNLMQGLIARSFEHRSMRRVCEVYGAPQAQQFSKLHAPLLPSVPDPRLFSVADSFCLSQEARQKADYDLLATVALNDAYQDVRLALKALGEWQAIQHTPEAQVFLTALLLADRWTRRG